jgi:hypothetical protein
MFEATRNVVATQHFSSSQPFGFVRACSADIRENSAMFGGFLPRKPNGPEFARTAFGVVRVCSARAIHRKTYCVSNQKIWHLLSRNVTAK